MIYRFIARHLRTPEGPFGRLIARLMNAGNRQMNRAAIEALSVEPEDRVLEVGFGGGSVIAALLKEMPGVRVSGLDLSETMLTRAGRTFRTEVREGRLVLEQGTVESLPFANDSFDRVLTVNTIYFWEDPEAAARELLRVTATSGRLVIGYGRVEDMKRLPPTRHGFRFWMPDEVEGLLRGAGFGSVTSGEFIGEKRSFVLTTATPDAGGEHAR